jgi:hypothetical protein
VFIQALPEASAGWHVPNRQCGLEIVVVAMVFNGLEIAFAQAKCANDTFNNIGVRNAVTQWNNRFQGLIKLTIPV